MNATFLYFPENAPGSHLYFLAEFYNPHFFVFFSRFVPAMLLVCFPCLNPCSVSVSSVFPSPSSYSLLPAALSHSPGTSLLQYCISLRVSEHHLSHCHPQHAVNGALADSRFLIVEVRRQHQHLLVAHVFEGVAVTLKPHIHICLILSVKLQL